MDNTQCIRLLKPFNFNKAVRNYGLCRRSLAVIHKDQVCYGEIGSAGAGRRLALCFGPLSIQTHAGIWDLAGSVAIHVVAMEICTLWGFAGYRCLNKCLRWNTVSV